MTTAFPNIQPTSRELTAEIWPTNTSTAQSGVVTRRLWGSRASGARLKLGYANRPGTEVADILASYAAAKGPVDDLTLQSNVWKGMNTEEQAIIGRHRWYFAEGEVPASVSGPCGLASIEVEMIGEIHG